MEGNKNMVGMDTDILNIRLAQEAKLWD